MSIKRVGGPLPQNDLQVAKRAHPKETTIHDLPQDCVTHVLFLSEGAPIFARVCKSWQTAALNSYPFILKVYTREIPYFVPADCSSALEAIKRTYLAVMRNGTRILEPPVAMASLDRSMPLAMPLVLGPVAKIKEDENLVQFFKKLEGLIPHHGLPMLEGDLPQKSATIRNWMKNDRASLDRVKGLEFFDYPLIILPPEIGQFRNLQSLSLFHRRLVALPPEIGKLTQLTDLNLTGNQLTTLPEEIFLLTSLKDLNLASNRLTTLPEEIFLLTSLESLTLSNNQLTTLSPKIEKLKNLQQLWLGRNLLVALPQEIIKLAHLETLELSHIHLKGLHQRPLELVANLCTLDKIVGAFEEGHTEKGLKMFETLPTNTKDAIYAKLDEIIPFQKDTKWAELSFLNIDGRWTTNKNKIKAIRNFIITNF